LVRYSRCVFKDHYEATHHTSFQHQSSINLLAHTILLAVVAEVSTIVPVRVC